MITASLLMCLISCSKPKENNDINNIIATCIKETIGAGDSAKMAYRFFSLDFPDFMPKVDRITLKNEYDSIRAVLDTAYSYIVLNDTLLAPNKEDQINISYGIELLKKKKIETGFIKWDKTTQQVINHKNISKQLQLNIEAKYHAKRDEIREIGNFHFSNIVFNKAKDRASVYEQYFCGDRCGFEILMVLEKRNNIWIVANKEKIGTF